MNVKTTTYEMEMPPRTTETVATWCVRCSKPYRRPADDRSHRRCPNCQRNKVWDKSVPEGFEYAE